MTISYEDFIKTKAREVQQYGFDVPLSALNPKAKDWQKVAVQWAVRRGRAAFFQGCGFGKTLQQLMWGEQIVLRERKPVLLLCPVGVRQQTIREAAIFDIGVTVKQANSQEDVTGAGIWVTNYEKLHKFDHQSFVAVILDESGCIKEFKSKTRRDLCTKFAKTPYRLACTATPAPNEWMELGNHCEFLGVMPSNEMLSRWFINDAMRAGEYKLLDHAADDYWRWLCGWALCLSKPSDMGDYSDEEFQLPEITYNFEVVGNQLAGIRPGELFPIDKINVHTMHRDKRESCEARAMKAAEIVASDPNDFWVVWCDTDYEADQLVEFIPDAIEVRGSMPEKRKEAGLLSFTTQQSRIIISKPDIAGFGLNWQHCRNAVFIGLSYSFEKFYQATRRIWRFGQKRPVNIWVIQGESECAIGDRVFEKQEAHVKMQSSMANAMRKIQIDLMSGDTNLEKYCPSQNLRIPSWLKSKSPQTSLEVKAEKSGRSSMATAAM